MNKLEYKMDFQIRKKNVYMCEICCTYFTRSAFFIYNHTANHTCLREPFNCEESNLEQYFCGICRLDFGTIISLKKHIDQAHSAERRNESTFSDNEGKNYVCQNCSFQQCFKHSIYGCSTCSTVNSGDTHDKNKESVQCASLTQHFSTRPLTDKTLHRCYSRPVDADDIWFKCDKCAYKALYRYQLMEHISSTHINTDKKILAKILKCEKCTFLTTHKNYLKKHMVVKHTDKAVLKRRVNKKKFKCEKCTFTATLKSSLKRHINAKHTEDQEKKWFQCDQCTYETPYKWRLKSHFNNYHTDESSKMLFECEKCTFRTAQKSYLKKHINVKHAQDQDKKLFQCDQCTYKTPYKCALKSHFNKYHTDESSKVLFKCEKCTYTTTLKSSLKIHINGRHADGQDKKCDKQNSK